TGTSTQASTCTGRPTPVGGTCGRGRCCTTTARGTRRWPGPAAAGAARRSGSTATATTTTGSRTSWPQPPRAATAAGSPRPQLRDGQLFSCVPQLAQPRHIEPTNPQRRQGCSNSLLALRLSLGVKYLLTHG